MKKRLRKKLGMGEYRELGFELSGNLIEMDEEQGDAVFQRFVALVDSFGMYCGGAWDDKGFDLYVATGLVGTQNAERRETFLNQFKEFKEVSDFKAGDLQ